MKRLMCLYIPQLPIDRLQRGQGDLSPDVTAYTHPVACAPGSVQSDDDIARIPSLSPMAVTQQRAGTVRIVLCNRQAAMDGVCHGMTLAEAKALMPALHTHANDPEANLRTLEELAVWAQAFSPIVGIEAEERHEGIEGGALLLDVTGCERLFQGEENLLHQALRGLGDQGFVARGAVADTVGAAWAIAHAHIESAVVTHPGRDVEDLLRLPVGALRVDGRTVADLCAVGVETIEALMYLPRASLESRFGDGLLRRLDQALGHVPEPLTPFRPSPMLRSYLSLGATTGGRDIIHRAVVHVLTQFCEQLARRMVGVTRVQVTFYTREARRGIEEGGMDGREGGFPRTYTVGVSRATRSFKRLHRLITARLEQVRLPSDVDGVMVWAQRVEPLDDRQDELFEERDEEGFAELVDRLSVRLGAESVARAALVSDHQPERAYEYKPVVGTAEATASLSSCLPSSPSCLPLQIWSCPVEIPVVALAPEGPPTMFRFRSVEHLVVACVGPERLETGWWRGPHVQRDYFRVVTQTGQAFWVFHDRDNGRWFVHGVFE